MRNEWLLLLLAGAFSLSAAACGNDDENNRDDDNGQSQTIGGTYAEDLLLKNLVEDPTKPDYYVQSDLMIQSLLTIEPGVMIEFAPNTQLTIDGRSNGKLATNGTADEPVILTGKNKTPGSWQGVYIDNSVTTQNSVNWTTIEYGGGKAFGSGLDASNLGIGGFVDRSTLSITNSTFRHSKKYGVEMENESSFDAFSGNTFEGNQDFALRIAPDQLAALDDSTTFIGDTGKAGVMVFGGNITTDATWKKLKDAAPISVTGDIVVQSKLTIEPGVELFFDTDKGLTVEGRSKGILSARGSADDKILMTRMANDSWKGVYIDNVESTANVLENVTVEYGGSSISERGQKANLTIGGFTGNSTMEIKNCTFAHSKGYGIAIKTGSTVNADVETVNSFNDNASGDITRDY